jgi:glutamyl-tRNA reductase
MSVYALDLNCATAPLDVREQVSFAPDARGHALRDLVARSTESLSLYICTLPRARAVTHAFRVASGLDSTVLGEPQVLGPIHDISRH